MARNASSPNKDGDMSFKYGAGCSCSAEECPLVAAIQPSERQLAIAKGVAESGEPICKGLVVAGTIDEETRADLLTLTCAIRNRGGKREAANIAATVATRMTRRMCAEINGRSEGDKPEHPALLNAICASALEAD